MFAGATRRWQLAIADDAPACGGLVLFSLDVDETARAPLAALLSPAERERAGRFLFPQLADRFNVAHGRLRELLGALLQADPRQIPLATGEHGKPRLDGSAAGSGLQFNLSHSDKWGLIGWAWRREIGVDVEAWRAMRDEPALVRRYFSPTEIAAYEALPEELRTHGFFNGWTRKEAYIKAVGRGLGLPLDSFDIALDPRLEACLLRPSALCEDGRRWSLAAAEGPPGTSIAVVLESDNLVIRNEVSAKV